MLLELWDLDLMNNDDDLLRVTRFFSPNAFSYTWIFNLMKNFNKSISSILNQET
jgi:hypothetical protein